MNNLQVFKTWFLLRTTYSIVPILLGFDKCFTGLIVNWAKYVSPEVLQYLPVSLPHLLVIVGLIEIAAGLLVWFRPRFGAYLVMTWLGIVIFNLMFLPGMLDIIARDVVIAIGALALAWLTEAIMSK
ncbi:hypothetical protein KBD08_02270 [Candidatus Babeliales bacterium]|nr:hypothetical protein [Candidatus Babeliales bacterium]